MGSQVFTIPNKDYIVIDRGDVYQTAWSRANKWVNFATINKMQELMPTYDFTSILNKNRIAQRPIIEYNPRIKLMELCRTIINSKQSRQN